MNSSISVESRTTLMEQQSRPLNLTQENQPQTVSQLELTTRPQIQLPTSPTGENESNQILIPSEIPSQLKNETNSANQSSNLQSNVKPHVLLEKLPLEPRILKVSKEDIKQLCQVISEFQEQFVGY
jgi:hypothetical protein